MSLNVKNYHFEYAFKNCNNKNIDNDGLPIPKIILIILDLNIVCTISYQCKRMKTKMISGFNCGNNVVILNFVTNSNQKNKQSV